jgi:hypothetical protein
MERSTWNASAREHIPRRLVEKRLTLGNERVEQEKT